MKLIILHLGEFVIGRVIKAMNANWHPLCFRCEECNGELADTGFIKCQGRALCHSCNAHVKAGVLGKHICYQCQLVFESIPISLNPKNFKHSNSKL